MIENYTIASTHRGEKMTKGELTDLIAEKYPFLTHRDVEAIVNMVFEEMKEALLEGDRIEIRGFGSFRIKEYDGRAGRNPKTGESVEVPPKRLPHFKVGKELCDRINGKSE